MMIAVLKYSCGSSEYVFVSMNCYLSLLLFECVSGYNEVYNIVGHYVVIYFVSCAQNRR